MRIRRRTLLRRLAGAACVGGLPTVAYARWIEPNALRTSAIRVASRLWPASRPPLRVGHITDVHCDRARALERASHAARVLTQSRPDIVMLTGDFVTTHGEQWAARCADALAPLAACPLGAYAVLGNHDWWTGSEEIVERELARVGILVLRNSAARARGAGNLWVVGLESLCTRRDDAGAALRDVPPSATRLLLVHEPDYATRSPDGFAAQFSGHSHGGQVSLPGFTAYTPEGARRFRRGLYLAPHHPVYVSTGVGMVGPQFRLFCPPEVAVVTLSHEQER